MALFEYEICEYLNIPSIPKKKWDGEKSFKDGVAIVTLKSGLEACAAVTFDNEKDAKPRVKKVFTLEQFKDINNIYIVPSYMDSNVEKMDLDEESKEKAKFLVEEAEEIMEQPLEGNHEDEPMNEYLFDNIHNDEEAKAFIKAYNKKMKNKARVPKSHDGLIMRLSVIHAEMGKE